MHSRSFNMSSIAVLLILILTIPATAVAHVARHPHPTEPAHTSRPGPVSPLNDVDATGSPLAASGQLQSRAGRGSTGVVPSAVPALESKAENIAFVGHLGGTVDDVTVQGDLAFVVEGSRLAIFDVSDPAAPSLIGKTVAFAGTVNAVDVNGSIAYLVGETGSPPYGWLRVVDVGDPSLPAEMGACETPGSALGVIVSGTMAYVANGSDGLRLVDVSNPSAPTEMGSCDTPGWAYGVAVDGSTAYVANGSDGLRLVDVSNPSAPTEVGSYTTPGLAYGVAVDASTAYVADGSYGLRAIEVGNREAPVGLGAYDTPGSAERLALSGSTAYVADVSGGLRVVDIGNPSAPLEIGAYDMPSDAQSVVLAGGIAYVADGAEGLRTVDVSTPPAPMGIGFRDMRGMAYDVALAGSTAYVADGTGGLRMVNVSDPAAPMEVGHYDEPRSATGVAVDGSMAYVADGSGGLRLVDVSNPSAPTEVGSYTTPGYAHDVVVAGSTVYVGTGEEGLLILDVSDPSHPRELGACDTPGTATRIVLVGNLIYVADWASGLRVIDVSDSSNPVEIGFYQTPWYASDVTVTGSKAYVANYAEGVRVMDVSDPRAPAELGYYDTPGHTNGLTVSGGMIYVADGSGGFVVLRYTGEADAYSISGQIRDSSGNPVSDVTITAGASASVVTDADGAYTIRNLASGTYTLTPIKNGWTFTPEIRTVSVPPDATGQDFVGTPSALSLLVVPLRWQGTQAAFETEAQTQTSLFLDDVPLSSCRERVLVEILDVGTQNYTGFACSSSDCAVNSVRTFVRDELDIDPSQYDVVVGLVEASPCAPIAGCSNGTDTIWVTSQYDIVTAHELGHIFDLEDEYCSNQAGSTDSRCNDGDSQGDGAASGDVNWLDTNLPCDCPPDGSDDSSDSPCCNFGGRNCSTVNYGVCCLGNKNAAGGRSTMSFADAPGPRGFDSHDLAHLNTLPELRCETASVGGQSDASHLVETDAQTIVEVELLIRPDDSVTAENISLGYGLPTSASILDGLDGDYTLQMVDALDNIIWSQSFGLYFDYQGPTVLDLDYSGIAYSSRDVSFRIPHATEMSAVELYHGDDLIFSQALPSVHLVYLPLVLRR